MPSDKHNLTAMSFIFHFFDIALVQEVPFAILLYIQCILPYNSSNRKVDAYDRTQEQQLQFVYVREVLRSVWESIAYAS